MKRSMRNTVSVLIATAMTALAIFSAVTFTDALVGTTTTTSVATSATGVQTSSTGVVVGTASTTGGTLQYCPATGCSATTCHNGR